MGFLRNWKVWAGLACVGVGTYLAYRWYKNRKAGGLAGFNRPRWMGYGRTAADYSLARAFGAQTSQTVDMGPQPVVAAGDADSAPEGAAFSDDGDGADF